MKLDADIRAILDQHGKLSRPAAQVDRTTDLFSTGLDSQAVVNVMLAIEERFDFEFPDDKLNRETFATIEAIASVVQASLQSA